MSLSRPVENGVSLHTVPLDVATTVVYEPRWLCLFLEWQLKEVIVPFDCQLPRNLEEL